LKTMKTGLLTVILATVLVAGIAGQGQAARLKSQPKPQDNELRRILSGAFARWDTNHNGTLTPPEIIGVLGDPQTGRDEAAAATVVQHGFDVKHGDGTTRTLSLADVLALAANPESEKQFNKIRRHMASVGHELFLPGDPNIDTIRQGAVGDCYLLSPIAALVLSDPQAIRSMIRPAGDGFDVAFRDGTTIHVTPMTDSELILPGLRGKTAHGIWLSVLQKAYSQIKREKAQDKRGPSFPAEDYSERNILGGGNPGGVIKLLTGHQSSRLNTRPRTGETEAQATARVAEMLTRLTQAHRLMTTRAGQADEVLPAHIPRDHFFAVLGYDPARRIVHVFNPWGNNVTPLSPPGLVNGYPTHQGHFDVPLDEFVKVFGSVIYETDRA